MVKSIKHLILFLCCFFLGTTITYAASCPNATKKELSRAAANVKASYELIDKSEEKEITVEGNKTTYKVPNYAFDISIYNLTESIYAEVTTTASDSSKNVYASDATDGIYTFRDNNFGEIYNYIITIKSNGECSNLTLRTIKFTKPRYNAYSEYTYCQNSSNFYCQKFIGTEINLKYTNEFLNKIRPNTPKNQNTNVEEENIGEMIASNWKLYLIVFASIGVVALVVIGFIIFKKIKNKRWES